MPKDISQITGYKKLIAYQKSKALVLSVYKLTDKFPKSEYFVLVPQMRRAVISIAANIVEGYAKSTNEFIRFLSISIGSATELEVFIEISHELNYFSSVTYANIHKGVVEVKKLLYSLQKSLRLKSKR